MLCEGRGLLEGGGAEVVVWESMCEVDEGRRVSGSRVSGGTSKAGGGMLG